MKNLLIVDDSYTVRKVVEMLLAPAGYTLSFAENAAAAMETLGKQPMDAVILDLSLPDKDGVTLAKEIKSAYPTIIIGLMKGSKEEVAESVSKDGTVNEIIEKPFDSQTFIAKLENLRGLSDKAKKAAPRATPAETPTVTPTAQPKVEGELSFDLNQLLGGLSEEKAEAKTEAKPEVKQEPAADEGMFDFSSLNEPEPVKTPAKTVTPPVTPPPVVAEAKPVVETLKTQETAAKTDEEHIHDFQMFSGEQVFEAHGQPAVAENPEEEVIEEFLELEELESIEDVVELTETPAEAVMTEKPKGTAAVPPVVEPVFIEPEKTAPPRVDAKVDYVKEVSLEELLESESIKEEEIKKTAPPVQKKPVVTPVEKPVEKPAEKPAATLEELTGKVSLEDIFADLSDILKEKKEEPKPQFAQPAREVKPVVQEVAKELKEFETVSKPAAEADDIWAFGAETAEVKKEVKEKVAEKVTEKVREELAKGQVSKPSGAVSADMKDMERMIRDITYDLVEKIAWEVVPEVIENVIKDKMAKK